MERDHRALAASRPEELEHLCPDDQLTILGRQRLDFPAQPAGSAALDDLHDVDWPRLESGAVWRFGCGVREDRVLANDGNSPDVVPASHVVGSRHSAGVPSREESVLPDAREILLEQLELEPAKLVRRHAFELRFEVLD